VVRAAKLYWPRRAADVALDSILVTPREAGALEFAEPDWRERFDEHLARAPRPKVVQIHSSPEIERAHAHDAAFEATLKDWRRFHATPTEDGKRMPASAPDGVIALARLGVMPSRRPHAPGLFEEQHDAHCQLIVSQSAWRIRAIEDKILYLERGWEPEIERFEIDLSRARWQAYCQKAVEFLRAAYPA